MRSNSAADCQRKKQIVLNFRRIILTALACFVVFVSEAQIVNRLNVDPVTFQSYAWGRMQQYNPVNLPLADSLYAEGVRQDNFRIKCLGPVISGALCPWRV